MHSIMAHPKDGKKIRKKAKRRTKIKNNRKSIKKRRGKMNLNRNQSLSNKKKRRY